MKFIDWYNFNFVEHKVMNLSSIYMEVMRKKSLENIDVMFGSSMSMNDAVKLFGDWTIIGIAMNTGNSYELCAIVYREDN